MIEGYQGSNIWSNMICNQLLVVCSVPKDAGCGQSNQEFLESDKHFSVSFVLVEGIIWRETASLNLIGSWDFAKAMVYSTCFIKLYDW